MRTKKEKNCRRHRKTISPYYIQVTNSGSKIKLRCAMIK